MEQPNTPFNEEELLQAAEEAYEKAVADQPASDPPLPEEEEPLPIPESDESVLSQEAPQPKAMQKSFIANTATNGTVIGIAIGFIAGIGLGLATRAVPACLVLGLMLGLLIGLLFDLRKDKKAALHTKVDETAEAAVSTSEEAAENREEAQYD